MISGPVPKRSDQRRRNNKPEGAQLVSAPAAPVFEPPEANPSWHPLMIEWFESLKNSGQSAFYEPSDWETAKIAAFSMSQELASGEVRAAMLREFMAIANLLMTTEGARRKLRVELQRGPEGVADDESVSVMADYKEMFS